MVLAPAVAWLRTRRQAGHSSSLVGGGDRMLPPSKSQKFSPVGLWPTEACSGVRLAVRKGARQNPEDTAKHSGAE